MKRTFFLLVFCAAMLPGSVTRAKPSTQKPKTRVVLISVDGLRADLAEKMPFFTHAAKIGVSTFEAQAPVPSVTVVSHTEMFTGRLPADNGVSTFEPDEAKNGKWRPLKVETIFQAARKKGLKSAAYAMKQKFDGLLPAEAVDAHETRFKTSQEVVKRYCLALGAQGSISYDLVFLHFAELDVIGHGIGWMTPQQIEAAGKLDALLTKVADCVAADDRRSNRSTLIIVTSDHGGHGKNHGTDSKEDRTIPWVAFGHGVAAGNRLLDITLVDTAAVIADALGLRMKDLAGTIPDGLYDH